MPRPIPENPIVLYLRELLSSGKTTKEKICVVCDIKYPTFDNTFIRPTVSQLVRTKLVFHDVVPKNVNTQYDVWFQKFYLPTIRKKHASDKTSTRSKDIHQGEAGGTTKAGNGRGPKPRRLPLED